MFIRKNIIVLGSGNRPMLTDVFYLPNQQPKPVVIYVHGFNGFKDWGNFDVLAKQFALNGLAFVKFNLSHNGTSLEHPDEFTDLEAYSHNNYTKEADDVHQIIQWVKTTAELEDAEVNRSEIYLLGHSRGGGIAIITAAENREIRKLATWASLNENKTPWGSWSAERLLAWQKNTYEYYTNARTKQQMPLHYQLYENYQNNKERLDINRAIASLRIPILICHGSNDEAVPVTKAHQLKEWQPAAELFILPTDHVFGRTHPNTQEDIPEPMKLVLEKTIAFFL